MVENKWSNCEGLAYGPKLLTLSNLDQTEGKMAETGENISDSDKQDWKDTLPVKENSNYYSKENTGDNQ